VPFFPVRNGEDFLGFLGAIGTNTVPDWFGKHPETATFVQYPKPPPQSFATEPFFAVNAFKLISSDGKETTVRYQWVPSAGVHALSADEVKGKGPNFLYEEIRQRVSSGPVTFTLKVQVAEEGDPTHDATIRWPDSRKVVELGKLTLDKVEPEDKQAAEQKQLIMDPVPRVEGIKETDDPLFDVRAAMYLISGKERRSA